MPSPRESIATYLSERRLSICSRTYVTETRQLSILRDFIEAQDWNHLGLIESPQFERYRRYLEEERRWSSGTIIESLRVVRSFLAWARAQELTLVDPGEYRLAARESKDIVVPSEAQLVKLLEAPAAGAPIGLRDRLILEFFYTLGLRRQESHELSLSSVSFSRQELRVMGKGAYERVLPLSSRLLGLLQRYLKKARGELGARSEEEALWVTRKIGTRLGSQGLYDVVIRHARRVGLVLHPHILRHACATHMLKRGACLRYLQLFLGHRCVESTEHYAHVGSGALRAEFARCHPRASLAR